MMTVRAFNVHVLLCTYLYMLAFFFRKPVLQRFDFTQHFSHVQTFHLGSLKRFIELQSEQKKNKLNLKFTNLLSGR